MGADGPIGGLAYECAQCGDGVSAGGEGVHPRRLGGPDAEGGQQPDRQERRRQREGVAARDSRGECADQVMETVVIHHSLLLATNPEEHQAWTLDHGVHHDGLEAVRWPNRESCLV